MSESARPRRVAVIGYGLAGATFHAPLVDTTPGLSLTAIVTGKRERGGEAAALYTKTEIIADSDTLWRRVGPNDLDLDLVVIASPNTSHALLAHAALAAGLNVVVDKPLAVDAAEARALIADAGQRGLLLSVFHNRRWDADFLTLQKLIANGELGKIRRFESRFERWRPEAKPGWRQQADEAGGQLFDLGSHLIDQALTLFGPVAEVYAELDPRYPASEVDDDSFVALTHVGGVRSHLWMSSVAPTLGPRFRVLGSRAAYVKYGLDPQEAALKEGQRPDSKSWGVESQAAWGELGAQGQMQRCPSEAGDYTRFYAGIEAALRGKAPAPVDATDALAGLEIIEAARLSSAEKRTARIAL